MFVWKDPSILLHGKSFGRSAFSTFASRNEGLFKAIMIASGDLSGGISSSIAGGDFWQGL